MSFAGFILSLIIPLFILASGVYALLKLIKRWDDYKDSAFKLVGFFIIILIIFSVGSVWLLLSLTFSSVDILARPVSDPVFDIEVGAEKIEMETKLGEYRSGSVFGSTGYSNDWMVLNRKTVYLPCSMTYYTEYINIWCPGDIHRYINGMNVRIYPDEKYINASSNCVGCVYYRVSDFTSRGYALPDENNPKKELVPRR